MERSWESIGQHVYEPCQRVDCKRWFLLSWLSRTTVHNPTFSVFHHRTLETARGVLHLKTLCLKKYIIWTIIEQTINLISSWIAFKINVVFLAVKWSPNRPRSRTWWLSRTVMRFRPSALDLTTRREKRLRWVRRRHGRNEKILESTLIMSPWFWPLSLVFLLLLFWVRCDEEAGSSEIDAWHRSQERPRDDGENGSAGRSDGEKRTAGSDRRRWRQHSQKHPPVLWRGRVLLHHRRQAGRKPGPLPQCKRAQLVPIAYVPICVCVCKHNISMYYLFISLCSLYYSTAVVPTFSSRMCLWTHTTWGFPGWRSLPASEFLNTF